MYRSSFRVRTRKLGRRKFERMRFGRRKFGRKKFGRRVKFGRGSWLDKVEEEEVRE